MRNPHPVALQFPPFLPGHPWDTAQLLPGGEILPLALSSPLEPARSPWIAAAAGGFGVQAPGVPPPRPPIPAEVSFTSLSAPSPARRVPSPVLHPGLSLPQPPVLPAKFLPGQSLPPLSLDASGAAVLAGLGFLFLSLPSPAPDPLLTPQPWNRRFPGSASRAHRECPPGMPSGNAQLSSPAPLELHPTPSLCRAAATTHRGVLRRGFPAPGTVLGAGWGIAQCQGAVGSSGKLLKGVQPRGSVKIPASIICPAPPASS